MVAELTAFDAGEVHRSWAEWWGMPEFIQQDLEPFESVLVHFPDPEDRAAFLALTGAKTRTVTRGGTPFIWYPPQAHAIFRGLVWKSEDPERARSRYPVYIVTKGRWADNLRLTSRSLERMGVAHSLVVEGPEVRAYRAAVGPLVTVLELDPAYQRDYELLTDEDGSTGPGPARNFALDHSAAAGFERHWVMDDNIQRFYRLNRNAKVPFGDGSALRLMEDWTDRYDNVAMAGPNYESLVLRRSPDHPPLYVNTRIYSCNLIQNDTGRRWRGRYNEDTILSLDLLTDGWVTVLFNAFLQNKIATQRMAGGNTDEFYAREGTTAKSQMLADVYPDVARVTVRYGRVHHHVDYRRYRRLPRLRPGVTVTEGPDEHGLILCREDGRSA